MLTSHQYTHLVSKDHKAVVCFASDGSTHTLCCVAHRVKGQEVIFPDLKLVSEVFQSRLIQTGSKYFNYTIHIF